MSTIGFWTPVIYNNAAFFSFDNLRQQVDNLFYLGGKKAYVIEGKEVVIHEEPALLTAKKVAIFALSLVLLVPIVLKIALRWSQDFTVIDPQKRVLQEIVESTSQKELNEALERAEHLRKKIETITGRSPIYYIEDYKNQKLKALQLFAEVKEFHEKRGITSGKEILEVDDSLLDFSHLSVEQKVKDKLAKLARDIVDECNDQIQSSTAASPVKRRTIVIPTTDEETLFYPFGAKTVDPNLWNDYGSDGNRVMNEHSYMAFAAKKLIELGLIHKFESHGYTAILYV